MFHEVNTEVEGKQNSLFPVSPVFKCFVIPPNSKVEKMGKMICFTPDWLINSRSLT